MYDPKYKQYPDPPALDRLHVEKELNKFTDRELKWASTYLALKYPHIDSVTRVENLFSYLIEFLTNPNITTGEYELRHLLKGRVTLLIPQENINWLIKSDRAQAFICFYLKEVYQSPQKIFYENSYIDHIYSYIDSINPLVNIVQIQGNSTITNCEDKIFLLKQLEFLWKNIVDSNDYEKWIEKEDSSIVDWLYDYMKKRSPIFNVTGPEVDLKNKKILIFTALDFFNWDYSQKDFSYPSFNPESNRLIFIDKMKRAWSQQKYRNAGKTKKQYHLPLTKTAKVQLDKMSALRNQSQAVILNELINEAYVTEFIDENGKNIY